MNNLINRAISLIQTFRLSQVCVFSLLLSLIIGTIITTAAAADDDPAAQTEHQTTVDKIETLLEFFVERKLARRWPLGMDMYYGGDYFRNAGSRDKSYDEEMGGGLSLNSHYSFDKTDIKLSYIFGHRKVNLGNNDSDDSSKRFHNILASVSHQWTYGLSSDLNMRGSIITPGRMSLNIGKPVISGR